MLNIVRACRSQINLKLATLALLVSLLPFIAVHLSWWFSLYRNTVPECVPYFSGCVTISRAARSSEGIYLFKLLMLITSPLLMMYWWKITYWLEDQTGVAGIRRRAIMRWLGTIGAAFLILYVVFLGTEGEFYRWMRRYGVTIYFSFTALAQIFLVQQLYQVHDEKFLWLGKATVKRLVLIKTWLIVAQWSLGLISIPLGLWLQGEAKSTMNNIIEWNFALAMNSFFFLSYLLLRNQK